MPCSMLDFAHCEMTALSGRTRPVQVPLPKGNVSRTPQIESLEAWARMLKPSMVVGVRAGAAERHLEGSVWLLLVTSEAFAVPENLVHATAEYEAGYLVVRGRWFALEQRSPRGYTLPTEEVLVVVNTMIRVPWVLFNGSAAGKAPRESRSGLYILGEEWYNRLLESV